MTEPAWQHSLEAAPQIIRRREQLVEQRDPDSTLDAVDVLDRLERCVSAEAQLDTLQSLGERELRAVAWRMLALLTAERMNQEAVQELMGDPAWWDSYRIASGDPRLTGATSADVFRWALIHLRGGAHRYEQAVVKRAW